MTLWRAQVQLCFILLGCVRCDRLLRLTCIRKYSVPSTYLAEFCEHSVVHCISSPLPYGEKWTLKFCLILFLFLLLLEWNGFLDLKACSLNSYPKLAHTITLSDDLCVSLSNALCGDTSQILEGNLNFTEREHTFASPASSTFSVNKCTYFYRSHIFRRWYLGNYNKLGMCLGVANKKWTQNLNGETPWKLALW